MGLILSRESHEDRGAKTQVGQRSPQPADQIANLCGSHRPIHGPQDLIVNVLEGKIQIGTDLRLVSPEGNEPLGHVGRVHVEHSDPFEPFDPAKPLQESGEGGRRSQIPPIIAQVLGHQNQFLDSPTCQFLRLFQEGRQGLALQISPNGGYHAIGAEVSASFRDLQIGIMRRRTKQARKAHGILEGAGRKGNDPSPRTHHQKASCCTPE